MWRKRLQLGLIHVAVAMTLVPINSTLNRVMIKELLLPATLVALLVSLPYLFSPVQVAIGSFSDRHPILGLRRTPYIVLGLLLCVLGLIVSPQAAFLLANRGLPGLLLAALAFGAWGMGFNLASVSYFSLASELSGEKGRTRTIAVMFFMMIASIIATSISLSRLLEHYSPQTLVAAFSIVALFALGLGLLGLVGLEKRSTRFEPVEKRHSAGALVQAITQNPQATRFFWYLILMLAAILGQDVLLEPYAGEAFGLSVNATTRITSIWGTCVLLTLLVAGWLEGRVPKRRIVQVSAGGAMVAFLLIAGSGLLGSQPVFYTGVVLLGLSTGLATVSNLSLMLDMTTSANVGLFIGAWGMADAVARLVGSLLSGALRDLVTHAFQNSVVGYASVFVTLAGLLLLSLLLLRRIDVGAFLRQAEGPSLTDRAAILGDF